MALKTTLTNQQPQNAGDGAKGSNIFMLSLTFGAPLLLVCGGMLWLLWRRQTNRYNPALQRASRNAQVSLWMSNHEMDSNIDTLHYITGASGALPIAVLPETPSTPKPISQLPFPQPAYTPSRLPSITTPFPLEMFITPSNEAAHYPEADELLPWSMHSLNLPLQLPEAGESNQYGQMLPFAAPPMASPDISTLFSPFVTPVVSLAIQPPSTKDDPLLGEVMRQAQMGLFIVLGREKGLADLHTNY
jgi:hypothetical protein